jgi:hypothetical protein
LIIGVPDGKTFHGHRGVSWTRVAHDEIPFLWRQQAMSGIGNPGVLDAFAHDTRSGKLVMAMYERRPWDGGEAQLVQLQEKLNAYLSFALDGEMEESFPELAGKPLEIQLRTEHEPGPDVWAFVGRIREQLSFQDIAFEVVAACGDECHDDGGGCCGGDGCCHGV